MTELDADLAPYLHPDYWDGHSLGIGETIPFRTAIADRATTAAAKAALEDYLGRVTSRFALETFTNGDVFNPAAYETGAVVCMKEEVLLASPGVSVDFATLPEGLEPPERDARMQPGVPLGSGPYDLLLGSRGKGIMYNNWFAWGVVTRKKGQDEPILARIPAGLVGLDSDNKPVVQERFVIIKGAVEIGSTDHSGDSKNNRIEKLERILRLEVCAYGKPQEQRESRFAWLGRLVPGES